MNSPHYTVDRPPLFVWLLLELRVFIELIQVWFIAFLRLPKGDGRTVIMYPGLAARDWMTWPLRFALTRAGYKVEGWGLGRNEGPRDGVMEACDAKIVDAAKASGRPITLIGWSLGGLMARELAKRNPQQVRDVITMGSPFSGSPRANYAGWVYERLSRQSIDDVAQRFALHVAPPCPTLSIYTQSDGIVHWLGCTQPAPTHVAHHRVSCSHLAMPASFAVIRACADRMALPIDQLNKAS
jgi:pimeloyl-ACP methyl ester carboxylesterase